MMSLLWLTFAALAGPFEQPSFREVDTGDIFESWGCRPSRDTFAACVLAVRG